MRRGRKQDIEIARKRDKFKDEEKKVKEMRAERKKVGSAVTDRWHLPAWKADARQTERQTEHAGGGIDRDGHASDRHGRQFRAGCRFASI